MKRLQPIVVHLPAVMKMPWIISFESEYALQNNMLSRYLEGTSTRVNSIRK